ncbi:hypothetical protein [Amycolatopsis sp. NPDC051071]|uniref:hypothetical protein n=1 Tax=Amycolatopsis sp. NPDC051071 TaxID=3154637 RepID=UPI003423BA07
MDAVVAVRPRGSDGQVADCPAAPVLATSLRRRGLRVDTAPLEREFSPGIEGSGVVWAVIVDKRRTGFATATEKPALEDVVRSVVLAEPRSLYAGVERAIEVVQHLLKSAGPPVYVRKQVVHNTHVVRDLKQRGAVFVDQLDKVHERATVVFSARGHPPAVRAQAAARGLDVVDATCPLVTKMHHEASEFTSRSDIVALVGHAGREETEGTLGQAPDRRDQFMPLSFSSLLATAHTIWKPQRVGDVTQPTHFPLYSGKGSHDRQAYFYCRQSTFIQVDPGSRHHSTSHVSSDPSPAASGTPKAEKPRLGVHAAPQILAHRRRRGESDEHGKRHVLRQPVPRRRH